MAFSVASRGLKPCPMRVLTSSTTTMASSTTEPMARTRPNKERELMENPRAANAAKVPIMGTGTTRQGINVALKFPRKINTTSITRPSALKRVNTTSLSAALTNKVLS